MTIARGVYPSDLEADIALRDGSLVQVRPVRPSDAERLLSFLRDLPDEDRRLRFFSLATDLARTARDQTNVDYVASLGLLAVAGPDERVVGHALYATYKEGSAEVAFAIAHDYQGRGLATLLLGQLAQAAAANGIDTFEALVLPENARMLEVFRESGFPLKTHYTGGGIELTFPTSLTPEALTRFEQRDEASAAAAVRRLLYPRSVAVIGASRKPGSVGGTVLQNLVGRGFPGPVYAVNPGAASVQSLPCYPSVEAIPEVVDLAVVALPASLVVEAAEQCGRKGVSGLIVLSAGFNEVGEVGMARQAELVRVCGEYGVRLLGPNCIGVVNTDPGSPLNATLGRLMPSAGRIALASQSGAMALAAIDFTAARESFGGFSSVVSMGNKADLSTNDLLGFWHTDPRTDVILLYVESFGNPRKFARLARSITRSKPIVAVKSGRSAVGARATASRTGALLAASDVTIEALFRQAGVVRTDTLDEMLDVADLLVHQPLPAGPRVAIVTNVGGPAVMCADACEARGLLVSSVSTAASAEEYSEAVRLATHDPRIDSVIVIFLPKLATTESEDVGRALAQAVTSMAESKPVLAVFMSADALPDLTTACSRRIPAYRTPEPAAIALAHAVHYATWRCLPLEAPPELTDLDRDAAALLLAEVLRRGDGWLAADEVWQLLGCYGVRIGSEAQLKSGVEMLVGVVNDRQFGPTIACGAGGARAELLRDMSVRLSPLTRADAASMVRDLRIFPLLDGHADAPLCDVRALEDVLLRIGALAEDHACIAELDLNPVIVCESGSRVVDARVRIEQVPPRRPLGARR
jgi:acyl-CoA synthetase (NDP forming)/RimJ/RimL family protein N-acetyltransferase